MSRGPMTWADLWWQVGLPFTVVTVPLLVVGLSFFVLVRVFRRRWRP